MIIRALKILFLLVVASPIIRAQDKRVAQFINATYHDIVPEGLRSYYLLDTAEATNPGPWLRNPEILPYITEKDPAVTLSIIERFNSPDAAIRWSEYNLQDAIVLPNHLADSISSNDRQIKLVDYRFYEKHKDSLIASTPYNEIYAPVNFKWIKKEQMRILRDYGDSLEKRIPAERRTWFRFSRPVFTDDDQYAMIWYGDKGVECLYIYRKEKQWKRLAKVMCIH